MILQKKKINQPFSGIWIASGSPVVAEIAAECGFDWLLLDLEHGCLSESDILHSLMAVKGSPTKPIVRVGKTDPVLIARVLDWGAAGIMLPHVSRAEQAIECLDAMYYPPKGQRGYTSSARAYSYGLRPPTNPAAAPIPLFLAQIEDREGVENAKTIAAVPGVDVLFVGPSDLKLDLSAHAHPMDFQTALSEVSSAAALYKKQAGILIKDRSEIPDFQNQGYSCLALGSDLGVVRNGFRQMLDY